MFVEHTLKIPHMSLSKSEEELMNLLWKRKKALLKELIDAYPEPKPATTTVATLLKRMADKGFVAYTSRGRSREYYPLVKKKAYFSKQVNTLIKNFFNDSPTQFASFFTQATDLSKEQLEDLRNLIDDEISSRPSETLGSDYKSDDGSAQENHKPRKNGAMKKNGNTDTRDEPSAPVSKSHRNLKK